MYGMIFLITISFFDFYSYSYKNYPYILCSSKIYTYKCDPDAMDTTQYTDLLHDTLLVKNIFLL